MTVLTNIAAMKATHAMAKSHARVEASMVKLSTGSRINSAKDDASGLAISNELTTRIASTVVALKNAGDAINMVNTADAAVSFLIDLVQRGRELTISAANGTLSTEDKSYITLELNELKAEFANICEATSFNGKRLFGDEHCDNDLTTRFLVGPDVHHQISVDFSKVSKDLFAGDIVPVFETPLTNIDGEIHLDTNSWEGSDSIPSGTAFADFNNDGIDDIVFSTMDYAGSESRIKLLYGNEDGSYSSNPDNFGRTDFTKGNIGAMLEVADVNGDGFNDLVYLDQTELKAMLNDGVGNFSGSVDFSGGVYGQSHTVLGDVTGDCFFDIVVSSGGGPGYISTHINNGDNTFQQRQHLPDWPPSGGHESKLGISLLDIDGDGDLDELTFYRRHTDSFFGSTSSLSDGHLLYAKNTGDGTFMGGTGYLTDTIELQGTFQWGYAGLAVGDVDGDGKEDLLIGTRTGVEILKNTGTTYGGLTLDSSSQEYDDALETLLTARAEFGAKTNQLFSVVDHLTQSKLSYEKARSKISDTNYATEVSNLASEQIIHKASSAMLAQANASQEVVFALLKEWL